jgi:hypothetical protein
MHDLDAGRIFWKEWRAQRSFWLGLFGLAIGLELVLLVISPLWMHTDAITQLRIYQGLVTVLACCFATGSAAIAFAGEVEAKTKGLLQRIPVRPRDLLAGKLSLSLVGSYALLIALWLAGGLMLMQSTKTPFSEAFSSGASRAIAESWIFLLGPSMFVVMGGLFSLILSDVLLTVLIAGLSTAAFLAVPVIRDHLALQAAVIAIIAVCDFFLAKRWLVDAGAVEWTVWPHITFPQLVVRPRRLVGEQTASIESVRSAVAWRRAGSSLIWKEFRQAFPFCVKLLGAGLIGLACVPLARESGYFALILIAFVPLLPGVAAIRAERKDDAFRLLANRGVTTEGLLICKHLVWLSLSLLVFAVLLLIDRSFLANLLYAAPNVLYAGRWPSLWGFAATIAMETFGSAPTSVIAPLAVAAVHIVLLYASGFLLGLLLRGAIAAFFTGAILSLGFAFCWAVFAYLQIPFWWTIGLFPVILLAASWVRTGDWLIGRNAPAAWGKVAATLMVPLVCILAATAVFRAIEIPAVAVPRSVLESGDMSETGPAANAKRSLFVDALGALSDPQGNWAKPNEKTLSDGWQYATRSERAWVADNAPARKLALEAAQREPGSFPFETHINGVVPLSDWTRMSRLAQLLLDSARKFESEDRLDEALSCYVAVARLGSDAARSDELAAMIGGGYAIEAFGSMRLWAAHPKQSTERIKQAIREFEQLERNAVPRSTQILRSWQINRRLLRRAIWGDSKRDTTVRIANAKVGPTDAKHQTVSEMWWMRWLFPWELMRLERLVDAVFATHLSEAEAIESDLQDQGFVTMTAERAAAWNRGNAARWKYDRTTLAPPDLVELPFWRPGEYVNRLAIERMNLIALAIADFKREHHKRPDTLRALVPTYFQRLPVDPWTGGDFLYEPQGLPLDIAFEGGGLKSGVPFLASAGMLDSRFVRRLTTRNGVSSLQITSRFGPEEMPRLNGAPASFPGPVVRLP